MPCQRRFVFFLLVAFSLSCVQRGQKRLVTIPKMSEFKTTWVVQLIFKGKGDNLDFFNTYMQGTGLNELGTSKCVLPLLKVYLVSKDVQTKVAIALKPVLQSISNLTFTPSKAIYLSSGGSIHEAPLVMVSKEANLYKEAQNKLYEALVAFFDGLSSEEAQKMGYRVDPLYLPTEYEPVLVFAPEIKLRDHQLYGDKKAAERDDILDEVNKRIENTSSQVTAKSFEMKLEW